MMIFLLRQFSVDPSRRFRVKYKCFASFPSVSSISSKPATLSTPFCWLDDSQLSSLASQVKTSSSKIRVFDRQTTHPKTQIWAVSPWPKVRNHESQRPTEPSRTSLRSPEISSSHQRIDSDRSQFEPPLVEPVSNFSWLPQATNTRGRRIPKALQLPPKHI